MAKKIRTKNRLHRITGTLSYHRKNNNDESHFDLFFLYDNNHFLVHYFLPRSDYQRGQIHSFRKGNLHRLKYLTYSGRISQNRGFVRVLIREQPIEIHSASADQNLSLEKNWPNEIGISFNNQKITIRTAF